MNQEMFDRKANNAILAMDGSLNPKEVLSTIFRDVHVEAIEMVAQKLLETAGKAIGKGEANMANLYNSLAREVRSMKTGAR